ncbi:hypothetical protein [Nocardioides sp. TF02-7]|uniref:hypothetical protein n=1 Tax=Nocardioides sp. TF02-7 TaxID=2917724 RepID=UPI001F06A73A|nr:hypothetical protein [Nocardioides sp. TF02-7]UMG91971.1 hypothetical protein MF408_18455 [Nocardioides sp. TF02-7]
MDDVKVRLRPRLRAAVLVEDRLVADDHAHLVEEARALGLDRGRAGRAVAEMAAELDVPVEPAPTAGGTQHHPPPQPPGRPWEDALRAARGALRRGALLEARRLVATAAAATDPVAATPVRAVADEVEQLVREAELRWRAAATALAARRFAEAADHLEHLSRTATDLPPPAGLGPAGAELDRARREVAEADARVAGARAEPDPVAALLAVLDRWPQHPTAVGALAEHPLHPPTEVRATRSGGVVVVAWQPSATPGVTYRVSRIEPDGTTRVVGRTGEPRIEDGGAPAGPDLPGYAVVAVQPGRRSEEARSSGPAPVPASAATPAAPTGTGRRTDRCGARGWSGGAGRGRRPPRRARLGRGHLAGARRSGVQGPPAATRRRLAGGRPHPGVLDRGRWRPR